MEKAHEKEAIPNFHNKLIKENVATEEELVAIETAVDEAIEAAYKFATESEYPDPSEATTDVYSSDNERSVVR